MLQWRVYTENNLKFSKLFDVFQDGGVFTFGSGKNGQLGHSSNFHQFQPLKVQ